MSTQSNAFLSISEVPVACLDTSQVPVYKHRKESSSFQSKIGWDKPPLPTLAPFSPFPLFPFSSRTIDQTTHTNIHVSMPQTGSAQHRLNLPAGSKMDGSLSRMGCCFLYPDLLLASSPVTHSCCFPSASKCRVGNCGACTESLV